MQINEEVQIFIFKEYSKCGFGHNADSIQGGFFCLTKLTYESMCIHRDSI